MGAYGQLVPIFLVLALAPLIGVILFAILIIRRRPADRPAVTLGLTRTWLIASLVGACLGVIAIVASWLIVLAH